MSEKIRVLISEEEVDAKIRQIAAKASRRYLHGSQSFLNAHHSKRKTSSAVI